MFKLPRIVFFVIISIFLAVAVYAVLGQFINSIIFNLCLSAIIAVTGFVSILTYNANKVRNTINEIRKFYKTTDLFPFKEIDLWVAGVGYTGRLKHQQSALYTSEGIYVFYGAQLKLGSVFLPWDNIEGGYDIAVLGEGTLCFAALYKDISFLIAVPFSKEYRDIIPSHLTLNP